MRKWGLATTPIGKTYLKDVYGALCVTDVPMPLFIRNSDYFLGGLKGIDTLLTDLTQDELDIIINEIKIKTSSFISDFAVTKNSCHISNSKVSRYIIDLRNWKGESKTRFSLYTKKKRNQVRKSLLSPFQCKYVYDEEQFFNLYTKTISRLGGLAKTKIWFEKFIYHFRESICFFGLYDGDVLVAANLAVQAGKEYVLLIANCSDSTYWSFNVNDRLYDELIRWSIEHNVRIIDLGPTAVRDISHVSFKEEFGAIPYPVCNTQNAMLHKKIGRLILEKKRNFLLRILKLKIINPYK